MKKKVLKILLLLLGVILVSGIFFLILFLTGIIYWDNGFSFNLTLFNAIRGYWCSWLVFLVLQVIFTTLLSFAPGGSMTFILVGVGIFGANWQTFLLCFSGVIISSFLMDLIGRFGGSKIIIKLIGEEDFNKADKLIKEKGISYLPLFYLFPLFPDDAICMLAGMLKVNFLYHSICILLCRGIGVATIVFGISIIPFETFDTLWDWIICITVVIFWIIFSFYVATKINKWLEKRNKK